MGKNRRPLPFVVGDRHRVVIERVDPEIDGGRFPIKRVVGDRVTVEAEVFGDGHEAVACALLYRKRAARTWQECPMRSLGNDRWRGEFPVTEIGEYHYTIVGWPDRFQTWRADLEKRVQAGQDVMQELLIGAGLVEAAADRARGQDAKRVRERASRLRQTAGSEGSEQLAMDEGLTDLLECYPDRSTATRYPELTVVVDRAKARFSTWYELFPRSWSPEPGRHGTFRDVAARLGYVAGMGFDVLYLPPIHPIAKTFRKGKNNSVGSTPEDIGSPWAIGGEEGGHTAIHPQLGSLEDFEHLVATAKQYGMEVALDLAFHCAADHPYLREHPEWFRQRPDGTIQYAENPPKKYQDIYPLDFDSAESTALWQELQRVVLYWVKAGVRIFRVDNPHTKPFAFWEWLIGEVKAQHPDVIFLSEAFTRPKVMYRLAKAGFTQSYTYFTWRHTKQEFTEYFTELTKTPVREYFRANLWPNTPDILPGYLQQGGRPAFIIRLVLAATLGANYGIYGPAFELCENEPFGPDSEEYLHSEKYEIKQRDLDAPWSLKDLIAQLNRCRREHPALQSDWSLRFHGTENDQLLCYSKSTEDFSDTILMVVNLDYRSKQAGFVTLDLPALGIDPDAAFQVDDLLAQVSYRWQGARNYVELDPATLPAHVFWIRREIS